MKEKVSVTGVAETMIQTLYARAKETKKPDHKIRDDIAVELVEKIDYDFSKADQDMVMYSGVIARTIVLDQMVRQYLENHKTHNCYQYCMWIRYKVLSNARKILALVQC